MALMHTPEDASLGIACPDFLLPGTDSKSYGRKDLGGAQASLVMFICNHCPYVIAVEDRLVELGHEFAGQPVKMIAISSNDAIRYPADSFEKMQERAVTKAYPFPYLHDDSQAVALSFGAVCTPDFFLYDSALKLAYRGRLDDSWKEPGKVQTRDLADAIRALLNGQPIATPQRSSMGCSIKWKPESLTIT